eukprot:Lankesteria_metandrocarpae@DN10189_c0_g1_i1.p1
MKLSDNSHEGLQQYNASASTATTPTTTTPATTIATTTATTTPATATTTPTTATTTTTTTTPPTTTTTTAAAPTSSHEDTAGLPLANAKAAEGFQRAVRLFSNFCFSGDSSAATYFMISLAATAMRTKMRADDKRMVQRVTVN